MGMTRKKKILVIDDEDDILKTTKYILEDVGYEVHVASNGQEGMAKIREVKPDLIALDLILPGGETGFQIAHKLKAIPEYKDIPIIMLSCRKEDMDKYVAVKSGIMEYIEKPIDPDMLVFHINDILKS